MLEFILLILFALLVLSIFIVGAFKIVDKSESSNNRNDKMALNYKIITVREDSKELGLIQGAYNICIRDEAFCIVAPDRKKTHLEIPLRHVLGYEKISDIENKSISIGKAIVGGVLFGSTGALLGGSMGKKKEEVILLINYKNEEVFIILSPMSLSALQQIIPSKQAKPTRQTNIQGFSSNQNRATISEYDELEKLAELRDKGIITDDEFDMKKKQILGL